MYIIGEGGGGGGNKKIIGADLWYSLELRLIGG